MAMGKVTIKRGTVKVASTAQHRFLHAHQLAHTHQMAKATGGKSYMRHGSRMSIKKGERVLAK